MRRRENRAKAEEENTANSPTHGRGIFGSLGVDPINQVKTQIVGREEQCKSRTMLAIPWAGRRRALPS
eukprot:scaffold1307_cov200-Pinguiococcus_pyrenoidosus.AAC.9